MSQPNDARLEALTQRRAAVLAALPTTEEAVMALRDLVDAGLPGYTEPHSEAFTIPDGTPPALRDDLLAWEAEHQLAAQLWAEDRFKLGFALGAGLSAELFLTLP